jgi:hypothetical protein
MSIRSYRVLVPISASFILAACGTAAEATPPASSSAAARPASTASPTAPATSSPESAPSGSEGEVVVVEPGDDPGDGPSSAEPQGTRLADVEVELLVQVLENYGLRVGPPDSAGGATVHVATADDDAVTITLTERGGVLEEVTISDESGESVLGVDEMGMLLGIFAPEAQEWLVESLEAAMGDPSTPLEASTDAGFVTLELAAYTDPRGAIDLTFRDR